RCEKAKELFGADGGALMLQAKPPPQSRSRRLRWLLLGVAVVALLALGALAIQHSAFRPQRVAVPPQPDLTGIDPAVRQAIEKEIAQVKREPQSANAWGQLGCVFIAHAFTEEAPQCFDQAERLDPNNPMWHYFRGLSLLARNPEQALPKFEQTVNLA